MTEIQQIEASILKLDKVKYSKPTAMQLHRRRHAGVHRVQRQEDRRYYRDVQLKKVELNKRLADLRAAELLEMQSLSMSPMGQPILPTPPLTPPPTPIFDIKLPKRTLTRIKSKKRLIGNR